MHEGDEKFIKNSVPTPHWKGPVERHKLKWEDSIAVDQKKLGVKG
jgi:hypothetical protein